MSGKQSIRDGTGHVISSPVVWHPIPGLVVLTIKTGGKQSVLAQSASSQARNRLVLPQYWSPLGRLLGFLFFRSVTLFSMVGWRVVYAAIGVSIAPQRLYELTTATDTQISL